MIEVVEDNILNAKQHIIGHQTNCYTMGSGLALEIMKKFPKVKMEHSSLCRKNKPDDLLGKVQMIDCSKCIVANIFAQKYYGNDKNIRYTNYDALELALEHLFNYAKRNNLSVALPYKIGCGKGNGDWKIVKKIINNIQYQTNADITLYKYNK